jgi:hypothetical protein
MVGALDVRVNERVLIGGELAPLQTITSQGGTTFYGPNSVFGIKEAASPRLRPTLHLNTTMKP